MYVFKKMERGNFSWKNDRDVNKIKLSGKSFTSKTNCFVAGDRKIVTILTSWIPMNTK